jgi:hypothetical protein
MAVPRPTPIVCDVGAVAADVLAVDLLARLQLNARRFGVELRLRNASPELQELLALLGLREILGVEAGRQPEEREQHGRVEEERELDDPAF